MAVQQNHQTAGILYTRVIEREGLHLAATEDGWEPLWENIYDEERRTGFMNYNGEMWEVNADDVASVLRGVKCRAWKRPKNRMPATNEVWEGLFVHASIMGTYLDLNMNGFRTQIDLDGATVRPMIFQYSDAVHIDTNDLDVKLIDLSPAQISAVVSTSKPLYIDKNFRPIIVRHDFVDPPAVPLPPPSQPRLVPSTVYKAPASPPQVFVSPPSPHFPFAPSAAHVPPPYSPPVAPAVPAYKVPAPAPHHPASAAAGLRFIANPNPYPNPGLYIPPPPPPPPPAPPRVVVPAYGSFDFSSDSDADSDAGSIDPSYDHPRDIMDDGDLTEEQIARLGLQDVQVGERYIDSPIPDFLLRATHEADDNHVHSRHYSIERVYETKEEDECLICYQTFEATTKRARLICFCTYHIHCINSWFEKKKGPCCPTHQQAYAEAQRLSEQ